MAFAWATKTGCTKNLLDLMPNPIYDLWVAMRQRCRNPNHPSYHNYGGRGLTIDPRWDDFAAFQADMGPRPVNYTLERVDNNAGYGPDNCVWASRTAQVANQRPRFWADPMRYIQKHRRRWRIDLKDHTGRRHRISCATLDEALEQRANLEMEREMFKRLS